MLFWTIPQVFFLKLKPRMFFFVLYDRYSGLVEPLSPTTLYTLYYDHHQPPCTPFVIIITNHLVYPLLWSLPTTLLHPLSWSSPTTWYTLCYDHYQPPCYTLCHDRYQPPCTPFIMIITNHLVHTLSWSSPATLYTLCYNCHQPPCILFVIIITNHLVYPLL